MQVQNNSDFLFLYEAIQCNPNGDPDQENRPRMDNDTATNLVTDTRIKRYIRDFLKMQDKSIFVDMEGTTKVKVEDKLRNVLKGLLENEADFIPILTPEWVQEWAKIKQEAKTGKEKDMVSNVIKLLVNKDTKYKNFNLYLLSYVIRQKFIDIRLFGSAFAVAGFNRSYTGPIQLNWGYSLHKVKLMESNTIVTIMADDSSTFGKDYRVHYSLLAFNGTVNRFAARETGLMEEDLNIFRHGIWNAIPALPTRSKLNQYPRLYVELVYKDGYYNGHFGDLRQYVKVIAADETAIRSQKDYQLDTSALETLVRNHPEVIQHVILKKGNGITLSL